MGVRTLYLLLAVLATQALAQSPPHLTSNTQTNPLSPLHTQQSPPLTETSPLTYKYFLFEESCYNTFFTDNDLLNFHCLKLTLSKVVGYGLVYGSLLVKAPQILKIMRSRSVLGISFSSVVIEALMNSLMIGYNIHRSNPFSIYGENVFLGFCNLVIILSFFFFSKEKMAMYIKGTALLLAISVPLILQLAPSFVIEHSLWMGIFAFMASRLEQVRENHRNKATGQLSLLTAFLNFGGNVARSFTILTEAGNDLLYLLSNAMPILVNGYILVQFLMYWDNKLEEYTEVRNSTEPSAEDEVKMF